MMLSYSRDTRAKPLTLSSQRIVQRIRDELSKLAADLILTAEADSYHQLSRHVLSSAPLQVTDSVQSFRQGKALQQLAEVLPELLPMSVSFGQQEALPYFVEFFTRQIGARTASVQLDIKALLNLDALEDAQHPLRQKIQKELYSLFAYKQALSLVHNAVHLTVTESSDGRSQSASADDN